WARSSPSTWRMSVVLPAPLAPTRPKTAPHGTSRLTRSRATLAPKRRVSSRTSTTASLASRSRATMESFLLRGRLHERVALANQVHDHVGGDVHLPGFGEEGVDPLGEDPEALTPGQRRTGGGDEGAGRPPRHHHAVALQLPVRLGHRVGVDNQLLR